MISRRRAGSLRWSLATMKGRCSVAVVVVLMWCSVSLVFDRDRVLHVRPREERAFADVVGREGAARAVGGVVGEGAVDRQAGEEDAGAFRDRQFCDAVRIEALDLEG